MTVAEILAEADRAGAVPPDLRSRVVGGVEYDSRRVHPGFLFFAFPGQKADGRQYAAEALSRGAVAVVSESPRPPNFAGPWIQVEHGRRALALAARTLFPEAAYLRLTAITGTNGKTTTSYLVDSVLRAAGKTTGLVGTIEYRVAGETRPAVNTTPESLDLYRLLAEVRGRGGSHVTMEVSSHALALGRVWGVTFHTAVFTNLTRDHLDFHPTMESYFGAKRELFEGQDSTPPRCAVLNFDDEYSRMLPAAPETYHYGIGEGASVRAAGIDSGFSGLRFRVEIDPRHGARSFPVESALVGRVNVYNILAACAAGLSHGLGPETIAAGIAACRAVPGRFERIEEGQPFLVVVDYAHTDDALRNALAVARSLSPKRVVTLFGCGGDRDRAKRPLMGQAAGEGSDYVVLTSDNPRSEDPLDIMNDALVGLRRFDTPHDIEPDREKAIRRAIEEARPGDLVLLAGKGHEKYQVLRDRVIDFDDREVARRILRGFGYGR